MIIFKDRHSSIQKRNRGLVSVAVLIALIIIVIISAGLLRVAFARRARIMAEERRIQASWLAESGLERATARLSATTNYEGETWDVTSEDLGGRGTGTVLIQVEKVADQPDRRKIHVQADFPANSSLRTRQSRELIIPITPAPR